MGSTVKKLTLHNCNWLPLEQLKHTTLLLTGGTGLVGFNILKELSPVAEELDIRILALVRDEEKARQKFAGLDRRIVPVQGDVLRPLSIEGPVDHIIHGASITSSEAFVRQPVETIMTSVAGVQNLLELARKKQTRSMVYLSSMEVYGSVWEEKLLKESDIGYLDPVRLRSSYPESKRLCENLCVAYAKEYAVPVKIARLAQTFGPGIPATDRRAIVQFITSALRDQDIAIKASGESARMYLYTFDAVTALLTLLLKGENGAAYNIANKDTYCSIRRLAQTIVQTFGASSRVLVNTGTAEERAIYPPDSYLRLDTAKLEALGWSPQVSLEESLHFTGTSLQ